MAEAPPAGGARLRVRALILSRAVDQAVFGLGSIVLARHYGPAAFAPAAALFVWNSLSVQLADQGLAFALLRLPPGTVVASSRLARVRRANVGVVVASLLAAVVWRSAAAWIVAGGLIWALAAEGYVRRGCWLKRQEPTIVARAEIGAAVAVVVGITAVLVSDASIAWVGAVFVARHVVEITLLGMPAGAFAPEGEPTTSGAEWFGQAMTYAAANVDYLVVAAALAADELSIYVISFRFASAVPALLTVPVTQQAFVELAEPGPGRPHVHDRLLERALALGIGGIVAVTIASILVTAFLGEGWEDVGPLSAVLALAVPWRIILGIVVASGLTAGGSRAVARYEAGRAAVIGLAVLAASPGGLFACAAAVTVATILTVAAEHVATQRLAGYPPDRRLLVASAVAPVLAVVAAVGLQP